MLTVCIVLFVASFLALGVGITAGVAGAIALTRAREEREESEMNASEAEQLYELAIGALETIRSERTMND